MANADESVLLLFDPLTSPLKPRIPRETPQRRQQQRQLDPTSPVAAFFSSVDKSKSLLATVRKHKQADLIDLEGLKSPLRVVDEHVEQRAGEAITPLPTFKLTMEEKNGAGNTMIVPVVDPFSPATYATSKPRTHFLARPLNLRDPTRNSLVVLDTPAKTPQADLLMSTNFTPVPSNLPYLLNASLSSLRQSGASDSTNPSITSTPNASNALLTSTGESVTASRRRRSSIDLDRELGGNSPDSSFDILRGELEIGNSADISFVTAAEDVSREVGPEESPWTIRTAAPLSGYSLGSGLMPVEEVRETSLLAHEIPLPDSCPTSPESSTGNNEDANMHASKVFSHTRRFSMAAALATAVTNASSLQFPVGAGEPSPPRSPKKPSLHPTASGRRPVIHARTTSMCSTSSVSSSRSGITIKGASPSKRFPQSPVRSRLTKPESPSKSGAAAVGSAKRLPRPSSIAAKPPVATSIKTSVAPAPGTVSKPPVTTTTTTTGTKPRASMAAPRPRASIVPRSSIAPRSSLAPRASMAPPPAPSASGMSGGMAVKRGPRASVQPGGVISGSGGGKAGPRPSISRPGVGLKQPLRAPRASMAPSTPTPLFANLTADKSAASVAAAANVGSKAGTVLTPGVRANAAHGDNYNMNGAAVPAPRTARPSLIGGVGAGAGAGGTGLKKMASFGGGMLSVVKEVSSNATARVIGGDKLGQQQGQGQATKPRPRTSSAGAALISRPEYQESALARPSTVGIAAARLVRPKSSLSRV